MLEFLVKKPSDAKDGDPVLVLLHGRGSDMRDLQGLSPVLPGGGTLVTPQAPNPGGPWGYGMGWAWYRYLGEGDAEAKSLRESLEALDGFMTGLSDVVGFEPGPTVLGGFSQGGTMSLAYALTHPGVVDGVVVLSGFMAKESTLGAGPDALGSTPLFWAHGTQDPAVPFSAHMPDRVVPPVQDWQVLGSQLQDGFPAFDTIQAKQLTTQFALGTRVPDAQFSSLALPEQVTASQFL